MKNIFLVFGYGIPENILIDQTYTFYLSIVFNTIFRLSTEIEDTHPVIMTCGGKTDMIEPYERTEADEMICFFEAFISHHKEVQSVTKPWQFFSENRSLSTLENMINSNAILNEKGITHAHIHIFCEQTRQRRITLLAKKIFITAQKITVIPIDFDTSKNRYLPLDYIEKKEQLELEHSLWALESPKHLKKHHEAFVEKFEYFRKAQRSGNEYMVKAWWDKKMAEIKHDNG